MNKKIRSYYIIGASFLLILIIIIISLAKKDNIINENLSLKKSLITEIKHSAEYNTILNFDTVTTFEWDKLYIVTPYMDVETYCKNNKIIYDKKISELIEIKDNISLLLFTRNNNIVTYINLDRNNGDFANYTINKSYTPENANFKFTYNKDGWLIPNNISS